MAVKKQDIRESPAMPGVYIFRKGDVPLYIGKAVDLKKRLVSYFRGRVNDKIARLRAEADHVEWYPAASEIDALICESSLIKMHQPKFNVLMRDDKNYFYVALTHAPFPRIVITHQPDASAARHIGPFVSGAPLRDTLRLLRRTFPYCTCKSAHEKKCLNAEIGRCPGYCCLKNVTPRPEDSAAYAARLAAIASILSGKRRKLAAEIKRRMRAASAIGEYERAIEFRDQLKEYNQ